jgi:hypothetical protein
VITTIDTTAAAEPPINKTCLFDLFMRYYYVSALTLHRSYAMSASFHLSPTSTEALSGLSDTLAQLREDLLAHLIPALTEELAASQEGRAPTNEPVNHTLRMLCDVDALSLTIDLLSGRSPNATHLNRAMLITLLPAVLTYGDTYPSLKDVTAIASVLKQGPVRTELEIVLKTMDTSHTTHVAHGRTKRRGWFRGSNDA